jgi:hypothetical protein
VTTSPERAFLAALRMAIGADAGVRSLLGDPARFYDQRPDDPVFPFVTIERVETTNVDASEAPALSHQVTLHVWSRQGGKAETLDALGALRGALHNANLSIESRRLVLLNVVYSDVFLTPDARAIQGVLRLRAITEPQ